MHTFHVLYMSEFSHNSSCCLICERVENLCPGPARLENKAVARPCQEMGLALAIRQQSSGAPAKQKSYSKKATRTPPRAVLGPFFYIHTALPVTLHAHAGSFGCDRKTFSAPRWTDRSTAALTKFHVLGAHTHSKISSFNMGTSGYRKKKHRDEEVYVIYIFVIRESES